MKADVGAGIHGWIDILRFPYDISFNEMGSGGIIGIQFLVLLPFLILGIKCRKDLLLFSILSIFAGSFFTGSIRFLYPMVILLSLYVAIVYETSKFKIIKVFFFLIISINIVLSFSLLEWLYRGRSLYSGRMTQEKYISLYDWTYPAVSYVNNILPKDSRVMIVGESRNFYLKRPYLVSSAIDYSIMKKFLIQTKNINEIKPLMAKEKIDFILFNPAEFNRLQKTYKRLGDDDIKKMLAFFKQLPAVYQKDGVFIYSVQ